MATKFVAARAYICDIPVETPRFDAIQSFESQETIVVELQTDDGTEGRGYAYTIGTGGTAVLELLHTRLLDVATALSPHRAEAIWTAMFNATHSTMVGPITTLAMAAVDTAVWDIQCRLANEPLWQRAGGAQGSLEIYETEGGWLNLSISELVDNARSAKTRGFAGFKLKIGKPRLSEDIERVASVRDALGPDLALMVDANQRFTIDEAVRWARALEPFDLTWLEEPLPADDVRGHAILATATSIPIAVGESLYSLAQFKEYLVMKAASVLQPDVARIGGITPWLKVAHLAEAYNLHVAPHFLMELHVSLAAGIPNGRWVEWIPQLRPLTRTGLEVSAGRVEAPTAPGLGIEWSQEALKSHQRGANHS
jgi:L-alanine-DL-glutamate epimerase-like enolase superfamily enzyme